jgi:phospholipid/cholesterol/gamma-HCH transport system substrate-binding protein
MSDATVIRKERTEFFVGLFVVVGSLIMGILIWQFGKFSDRLEDDYPVYLVLQDASGIIPGGNVMFSGERVGRVQSKELDQRTFQGIKIELRIFSRYNIPVGSKFRVATSGLMGDNFISVSPPAEDKLTGEVLGRDGITIRGSENVLEQLPEQGKRIADNVEVLIAELDNAVDDVQKVIINFISISEKFDQRIMSEDNLASFDQAVTSIGETATNLQTASDKLTNLIEDSRTTVTMAGKPFERADKALAELEPTVKELHATIEQIHNAADQVTNGDGPVPALLTSSELRTNLESLVANLEQHGILGYKRGKNKEEGKAEEGANPDEASKGAGRGLFQRKAPATPREGPTGRPFGKN